MEKMEKQNRNNNNKKNRERAQNKTRWKMGKNCKILKQKSNKMIVQENTKYM